MCSVLRRMWDIKAILLYASVTENKFFTRTRSLKARKAVRSTNTLARTQTHTQACKTCHVTSTRIRVYLSVSSLKQDGWLANGNHGWNPTPYPCFLPLWESAPPFCDHPYAERATSPALFHTSFSRIILLRVFTLPKIQIYIWKIYLLYIIFMIYSAIYNYLSIIVWFSIFIHLQLYIIITPNYISYIHIHIIYVYRVFFIGIKNFINNLLKRLLEIKIS